VNKRFFKISIIATLVASPDINPQYIPVL